MIRDKKVNIGVGIAYVAFVDKIGGIYLRGGRDRERQGQRQGEKEREGESEEDGEGEREGETP